MFHLLSAFWLLDRRVENFPIIACSNKVVSHNHFLDLMVDVFRAMFALQKLPQLFLKWVAIVKKSQEYVLLDVREVLDESWEWEAEQALAGF